MTAQQMEQLEEGRLEEKRGDGFTTPSKKAVTEGKGSPDSEGTSATVSPSSSVESDDHLIRSPFEYERETDLVRAPTLGVDSDPLAIVSRIIREVQLCLMSALPAPDKSFELTSIVTPTGLYQLNQKTNTFQLILDAAQLSAMGLDEWLKEAENVSATEHPSLYPHLTLAQLNEIERLVRAHGGFSVTGYTCIEEFWLRLIMCNQDFPPLPNHYAKRFLDNIHRPIVEDVVLATRVMAHSSIIYIFIDDSYFEDTQDSLVAALEFTDENVVPLLAAFVSVGLLSFLFLRTYQDKEQALKIAHRANLILATTIGFAENWDNYGSLIFSENMVMYVLIPIVIVGIVRGFYRHEKDTSQVIDITEFTLAKFLWYSVAYALTEGSLWSLGMIYPLNSVFIFKDTSNPATLKAFYDDLAAVRYSVTLLALFAQLARHPGLPIKCQVVGRYASNIITATGEAFLDNAALSLILGFAFGAIFGNNPSPKDTGQLTSYFAFQALFATITFLVSFPITPELPEYKVISTCDETVLSKSSTDTTSQSSDSANQELIEPKKHHCFKWPQWPKRLIGSEPTATPLVLATGESPLSTGPRGPGLKN